MINKTIFVWIIRGVRFEVILCTSEQSRSQFYVVERNGLPIKGVDCLHFDIAEEALIAILDSLSDK